ncbi:cellulase family glycosylhydrolase [Vibrio sp. PP-XX7]
MSFIKLKKTKINNYVNYSFRQKLLFSCACFGLSLAGFSAQTWASVEPLSVVGNQIHAGGQVKSFAGNSLFWSNNKWGGEKFYTAETVATLKNQWHASIVRASMGIQEDGGYLEYPADNKAKVETVVKAAIDNDMYVIIDWHSHHAEDNPQEAINFFKEMAEKYGDQPNVIYELYNEPLPISWSGIIKPYAESVIRTIRAIDPDNLIVVGTPSWSQDVDVASRDPINGTNIAYSLHFYAGTHGQYLRDKATEALNNGIALFVTEWGSVNATGDGAVAEAETDKWIAFMRDNNLSNANWAYNDKAEGASVFYPETTELTASGKKVKEMIENWPYNITDPAVDCSGINVYPNWTRKDWEGGEPNHCDAGDMMVYQGNLYQANWHTSTMPTTDKSWTLVSQCK